MRSFLVSLFVLVFVLTACQGAPIATSVPVDRSTETSTSVPSESSPSETPSLTETVTSTSTTHVLLTTPQTFPATPIGRLPFLPIAPTQKVIIGAIAADLQAWDPAKAITLADGSCLSHSRRYDPSIATPRCPSKIRECPRRFA